VIVSRDRKPWSSAVVGDVVGDGNVFEKSLT
jgi:hypothetical protein